MRKTCKVCGESKPLDEFYPHRGTHVTACKPCYRARKNAFNASSTPEHKSDISRRCYQKRRGVRLSDMRAYRVETRLAAIAHYSGGTMKCCCCGESEYDFLTIDHVDNDGADHRRSIGRNRGSVNLAVWLKVNGYPEGFQVLCWNCNCAKGHYGTCPHTRVKAFAS